MNWYEIGDFVVSALFVFAFVCLVVQNVTSIARWIKERRSK